MPPPILKGPRPEQNVDFPSEWTYLGRVSTSFRGCTPGCPEISGFRPDRYRTRTFRSKSVDLRASPEKPFRSHVNLITWDRNGFSGLALRSTDFERNALVRQRSGRKPDISGHPGVHPRNEVETRPRYVHSLGKSTFCSGRGPFRIGGGTFSRISPPPFVIP